MFAAAFLASCSNDDSMEQHTALRPGDVPIVLSSNVQPESRTASPLPVNTSVTVWADDANSDAYFGAWQLTANASGKLCFKMMNNEKSCFVGVFLIRSKDFAVYSHF